MELSEDEKWEIEFKKNFGSTTDLAPSILAYYDNLNNSNHSTSSKDDQLFLQSSNEPDAAVNTSLPKGILYSEQNTSFNSKVQKHNSCTSISTHKSISYLSRNVQRIIAHSETNSQPFEDPDGIAHPLSVERTPKTQRRLGNKTKPPQKKIQMPLSKNMCKISQASNAIVGTIHLPPDNDESPAACPIQLNKNNKKILNECDNKLYNDDDKTPTNNNSSSTFSYENDVLTIKCDSQEGATFDNLDATNQRLSNLFVKNSEIEMAEKSTNLNKKMENAIQKHKIIENIKSYNTHSSVSKSNKKNTDSIIANSDSDDNYQDCIVEAKNTYLEQKISKLRSMVEKETVPENISDKSCLLNSPKLTYSRAILSNDSILTSIPVSNLASNSTEELNENKTNMVYESPLSSPQNSKNKVSYSEIAQLKHRPLSVTSICSTSSSSSSGSEPMTGKMSVSYLASIESLADHSGNEMASHTNLTTAERAAMEIVDSEKSYVADIGEVIKGYLEDWRRSACLKDYELKILFSNIKEIYQFNTILLDRLVDAGTDPLKIAKCFIDLKDGFEVYTIYCTSYPAAISLLTSILQASHTNALLSSTQKLLKHTLPLGSYLLKPVQRILKYHLLLDNLRKHIDSNEVAKAHTLLKEVARNIDQVKRTLEQQSRVKELSGILDGWLGPDLTVLGELRQEGLVLENNKPRVVFLFETMLIITKPKEDKRLQFKTYIPCKNLMLVEHLPGDPTSFNVLPFSDPRGQIKLTARNRDQKRLWAHQIKQAMLAHFDIPNRAKELVFKLGDEEDRTPDKNTWKWNTHQSSTPEYLERRHQYRRSEMRYRSKKARKNLVTALSIDDSDLSLARVKNESYIMCDHKNENCQCKSVKTELANTLKKQGRRKTEPLITSNFFLSVKDESTTQETSATSIETMQKIEQQPSINQPKSMEIKMYNTKTLPKRIVNLKKTRMKSIKETSKFYMDLPPPVEVNISNVSDDPINTELKITESTDDIHEKCLNEMIEQIEEKTLLLIEQDSSSKSGTAYSSTDEYKDVMSESITSYKELFESSKDKSQKDGEIISQLVLENKEFTKVLNKPPKKKSIDHFDRISLISSPTLSRKEISGELEQDLDADKNKNDKLSRLSAIKDDLKAPEPIYESLLRNVHVPYKFAPALGRSVSQQYQRPTSSDNQQSTSDSDYVTLAYSEDRLISIGNECVPSTDSHVSKLRNSDSNINYNRSNSFSVHTEKSDYLQPTSISDIVISTNQKQYSSYTSIEHQQYQQFKQQEEEQGRNDALANKQILKKSSDTISISSRGSKSDRATKEFSTRQSMSYKQGSEDLGSRIAHADHIYADPRTLFHSNSSNQLANILINKASVKSAMVQRDSVVSLTSSNDSVCDAKVGTQQVLSLTKSRVQLLSNNFESDSFYEKNIDDCLENDFRDSAIYSDDNEKRQDFYTNKKSPPPVPEKYFRPPPIIPTKPSNLFPENKRIKPVPVQRNSSITSSSSSSSMLSPISTEGMKNSSWVMQQVQKFQ